MWTRNTDIRTSHCLQYISQAETEETVCSFIATLVENSYNEFGDVIVQQGFDFSRWASPSEYMNLASSASFQQTIGLVLTIMSTIGLATYAYYLNRKVRHRRPWQPPKSITSAINHQTAIAEAGRLSRMNSGIVSMQSFDRSGGIAHGDMSYGGGRARGDSSTLTPAHTGTFA